MYVNHVYIYIIWFYKVTLMYTEKLNIYLNYNTSEHNSNANIKALIYVRLIRYEAGGSGETNTIPFGAVCRNTALSCRHNTKEMIAAFE